MKKKWRKNKSFKCKPFGIVLDKINYDFVKSKGNVSGYINDLITPIRKSEEEKEFQLNEIRELIYKK